MKIDCEHIMKDLSFLLERYSNTTRASINPARLHYMRNLNETYTYEPGDYLVHESLLEHVGMLPILATYFHPHLKEEIDLGKTLSMLAIHDTGELAVGDKYSLAKTAADSEAELKAALSLLHPNYHNLLLEYEAAETKEAKFAQSVDKLAPLILTLLTDKETAEKRTGHYTNLSAENVFKRFREKNIRVVEWDSYLHELCIELYKRAERHLFRAK